MEDDLGVGDRAPSTASGSALGTSTVGPSASEVDARFTETQAKMEQKLNEKMDEIMGQHKEQ
eukprot:15430434-Alexandrium_andersonii.AAC.1